MRKRVLGETIYIKFVDLTVYTVDCRNHNISATREASATETNQITGSKKYAIPICTHLAIPVPA